MNQEFSSEILTPGRELLTARITEIVLPGSDGEIGILAGHEDFIGLLGTGPVKIVKDGDDYWFMVSSGIYEVISGKVTLFAEIGEKASEVDITAAKQVVADLEVIFNDPQKFSPEEYPTQKLAYDLNLARVEIYRRTQSMH